MPKFLGAHPNYRRHKASGQAVVALGGNHCSLGAHGSKASRRENDRVAAEWLAVGVTIWGLFRNRCAVEPSCDGEAPF